MILFVVESVSLGMSPDQVVSNLIVSNARTFDARCMDSISVTWDCNHPGFINSDPKLDSVTKGIKAHIRVFFKPPETEQLTPFPSSLKIPSFWVKIQLQGTALDFEKHKK